MVSSTGGPVSVGLVSRGVRSVGWSFGSLRGWAVSGRFHLCGTCTPSASHTGGSTTRPPWRASASVDALSSQSWPRPGPRGGAARADGRAPDWLELRLRQPQPRRRPPQPVVLQDAKVQRHLLRKRHVFGVPRALDDVLLGLPQERVARVPTPLSAESRTPGTKEGVPTQGASVRPGRCAYLSRSVPASGPPLGPSPPRVRWCPAALVPRGLRGRVSGRAAGVVSRGPTSTRSLPSGGFGSESRWRQGGPRARTGRRAVGLSTVGACRAGLGVGVRVDARRSRRQRVRTRHPRRSAPRSAPPVAQDR